LRYILTQFTADTSTKGGNKHRKFHKLIFEKGNSNNVLLIQHCSGDKIEKNEMDGACSPYGGEEWRKQGSGGETEGKRPLGRLRRTWENNMKMDLQEVGCGVIDWIQLAQDRDRWRTLLTAVMKLGVPKNLGNLTS
jgi:hypothetical protein